MRGVFLIIHILCIQFLWHIEVIHMVWLVTYSISECIIVHCRLLLGQEHDSFKFRTVSKSIIANIGSAVSNYHLIQVQHVIHCL